MGPLLAARTSASGPISRFFAPTRRPRGATRICSHPLASHGAPARCSHLRLRTYLAIRCPDSSASCGDSHLLSSPCFAWGPCSLPAPLLPKFPPWFGWRGVDVDALGERLDEN